MRKIEKIFDILEDASYATSDFLSIFFTDYHTSYRRMRGLSERKYQNSREWKNEKARRIKSEEKKRFYNLLSKLKREGFLERSENGFWSITKKGRLKRKNLKPKSALPTMNYSATESPKFTIIIYDVPEREKRKRVW